MSSTFVAYRKRAINDKTDIVRSALSILLWEEIHLSQDEHVQENAKNELARLQSECHYHALVPTIYLDAYLLENHDRELLLIQTIDRTCGKIKRFGEFVPQAYLDEFITMEEVGPIYTEWMLKIYALLRMLISGVQDSRIVPFDYEE